MGVKCNATFVKKKKKKALTKPTVLHYFFRPEQFAGSELL